MTMAATSLAVDTSLAMASSALDAVPWITSSSAVVTAYWPRPRLRTRPRPQLLLRWMRSLVWRRAGRPLPRSLRGGVRHRPWMARARSRPCEESVAVFCSKLSHGHGSFLAHDTRNGDKRIILVQDYFPAFHATFLRSCTGCVVFRSRSFARSSLTPWCMHVLLKRRHRSPGIEQ